MVKESPAESVEHFLTAKQLKEALRGISLSKIYKMAESGELPCYRVGRALRFFRSEVLAALKGSHHAG